MKRLFLIFGITIILLSIILYSKNKFLGIYDKYITIYFDLPIQQGYEWEYNIDNKKSLELHSNKNDKWKFKAIKNGNIKLTFEYKNKDDVKYKIIYDFKIKNKKIYWIEGEGYGMTYYPNPY